MTSMWSGVSCAICGANLGRELLRITEPDRFERYAGVSGSDYARSWVECTVCGTVTNVQQPGNERRLETLASGYYEVDLAGSSVAEKYAKIMALPPEKSDNAGRVARIVEFMDHWNYGIRTASRRVLDIGAGTGVFLSRFLTSESVRRNDWSATAVEPDPMAAAHLRDLGLFTVIEGLYSASLGLVDFDLCTLNKVVEHVKDPVALLRKAAASLRDPFGVIYVELPDKLTVFHRPASDNILGALHCHLYDPGSVAVLLDRAGLVPMRIDRLFEPSGKISVAAFATRPRTASELAA
jgi:2-polyprenyl-3-methyl-5-hydroxy-6-metoxy-1,4-benzoquinol methylase